MRIKFFAPRWGSESLSWEDFCLQVKDAGFDGVESPVPLNDEEKSEIKAALAKFDLLFIGQYYQSFESDLVQHKAAFKKHLLNIIDLDPILIDSQTGKDYFSAGQNGELFNLALQVSQQYGVKIAHETHRNKALFAAHVAKELLIQNPSAAITADFSHWCNVSESLLEQQEESLAIAIERTIHIHARVGHAQSAQVSDPRATEWRNEIKTHLNWWDQIIDCRAALNDDLLTITPEFGPYPYMPALPYTKMPIADQWDINVYMKELLKKRYQQYL